MRAGPTVRLHRSEVPSACRRRSGALISHYPEKVVPAVRRCGTPQVCRPRKVDTLGVSTLFATPPSCKVVVVPRLWFLVSVVRCDAVTSRSAPVAVRRSSLDVLTRRRDGDPIAARVFDDALNALASALSWTASVLAPDVVILGGGLAEARNELLDPDAIAANGVGDGDYRLGTQRVRVAGGQDPADRRRLAGGSTLTLEGAKAWLSHTRAARPSGGPWRRRCLHWTSRAGRSVKSIRPAEGVTRSVGVRRYQALVRLRWSRHGQAHAIPAIG